MNFFELCHDKKICMDIKEAIPYGTASIYLLFFDKKFVI